MFSESHQSNDLLGGRDQPGRPHQHSMMRLSQFGSIRDIGLDVRWDPVVLAEQVNRRAALLSKMKIGRGSLVAIQQNGSARFFADLFAAWMVGAGAACLDPALTDAELKIITAFVKPAVLAVDRGGRTTNLSIPILDLDSAPPTTARVTWDFYPDDPALVLFTSGTTGNPKGVVLSFRALLARISSNIAVIGQDVLARALVTLPTHFGHGLIGNALTPLMSGGEIVLHPLGVSLASNLGRIIDDYSISFMSSTPALWRVAKGHSQPPAGSSLVRVHVGSAPLPLQLWSDIATWSRAEVVNCYGMTETANWVAGASSRVDGIAEGLVGKNWGSHAAIMDDDGVIQPTGCGEIVVKSPGLMSGYLDRPDLTAEVIRDGWFHTGDRGSVDGSGRIWLTGRIKEEINRAGLKINPAEIDLLLERHPDIAEACTFAISDPVSGEAVAALVRFVNGRSTSPECLQAWCRERLRQAAIPERWIVVDEIPRNARGKVNRDAVRHMFTDRISSSASNPAINLADNVAKSTSPDLVAGIKSDHPAESAASAAISSAVRHAVERAWTELLDERTFSANFSWSDAGGDSLNALRLWFRIETMLGKQLSLDAVDPDSTPSSIIAAIEKMLGASAGQSVSNPNTDRGPLVFFMLPAEGDYPTLVRFRAAFGDKVRFVVIQYPSWREMIDAGARFDALVSAAEAQIRAQCQDRVCFLAGYSFGGFVAWETARRLAESGYKIGFLGLIDTRRRENLAINPALAPRRLRAESTPRIRLLVRSILERPIRTTVLRGFLSFLVAVRAFWLLRPLGELAIRRRSRGAFAFQWHLVVLLRLNSLRKREFGPLHVPVTLFRSDDFDPKSPDYGWGAMCSQLTVVPVSVSHISMITETDVLCPRFLEVLEVACRIAT
jgi:oxalate---CoA ligase